MSLPPLDPPLRPEESRWLDGALSAEASAALERALAEAPERRARLEELRAAQELWRSHARRPVRPAAEMAEAVLARVGRKAGGSTELPAGVARAWAAAALLLIGIGATGALAVLRGGERAEAPATSLLLDPEEEFDDWAELIAGEGS